MQHHWRIVCTVDTQTWGQPSSNHGPTAGPTRSVWPINGTTLIVSVTMAGPGLKRLVLITARLTSPPAPSLSAQNSMTWVSHLESTRTGHGLCHREQSVSLRLMLVSTWAECSSITSRVSSVLRATTPITTSQQRSPSRIKSAKSLSIMHSKQAVFVSLSPSPEHRQSSHPLQQF